MIGRKTGLRIDTDINNASKRKNNILCNHNIFFQPKFKLGYTARVKLEKVVKAC